MVNTPSYDHTLAFDFKPKKLEPIHADLTLFKMLLVSKQTVLGSTLLKMDEFCNYDLFDVDGVQMHWIDESKPYLVLGFVGTQLLKILTVEGTVKDLKKHFAFFSIRKANFENKKKFRVGRTYKARVYLRSALAGSQKSNSRNSGGLK